jgi:hypothetical protein
MKILSRCQIYICQTLYYRVAHCKSISRILYIYIYIYIKRYIYISNILDPLHLEMHSVTLTIRESTELIF